MNGSFAGCERVEGRRSVATVLALMFASISSSCAAEAMKGTYPMDSVQPVTVEKFSENEVLIGFVVPPESMYYVAGVSYATVGEELRIVIDRCPIRGACSTMAEAPTGLGAGRKAEVRVPFNGGRIVMIHSDGPQQVHP